MDLKEMTRAMDAVAGRGNWLDKSKWKTHQPTTPFNLMPRPGVSTSPRKVKERVKK